MSMNMADPCIEVGGKQTQELTYGLACYTPLPCFLLQFFTTLLIPLIFTCRSYHSILLSRYLTIQLNLIFQSGLWKFPSPLLPLNFSLGFVYEVGWAVLEFISMWNIEFLINKITCPPYNGLITTWILFTRRNHDLCNATLVAPLKSKKVKALW